VICFNWWITSYYFEVDFNCLASSSLMPRAFSLRNCLLKVSVLGSQGNGIFVKQLRDRSKAAADAP
jgi:hypothetical protein